MADFILILRGDKLVPITQIEHDENFTKIMDQLNRFTVSSGTTAPTGANEPAGALGDTIFTGTNMYRHNGTAWVSYGGTVVVTLVFSFLTFSQNSTTLIFSVENESALDVGSYKVWDITGAAYVETIAASEEFDSYTTSAVLVDTNSYEIHAYNNDSAQVKTTTEDGLAAVTYATPSVNIFQSFGTDAVSVSWVSTAEEDNLIGAHEYRLYDETDAVVKGAGLPLLGGGNPYDSVDTGYSLEVGHTYHVQVYNVDGAAIHSTTTSEGFDAITIP